MAARVSLALLTVAAAPQLAELAARLFDAADGTIYDTLARPGTPGYIGALAGAAMTFVPEAERVALK